MTKHLRRIILVGTVLLVGPSRILALSTCPGTITGNYNVSDDLQATTDTSCITVNASSVTVNLNGHSIICNHSPVCEYGVVVSAGYSGVTIKNASIVSGTGNWRAGVENLGTSGVANTTTVDTVTVTDAYDGVINPYKVVNSVFSVTQVCLLTFGYAATSGTIKQNYCRVADGGDQIGFTIGGGSTSGTATLIQYNYIRATTTGISTDGNYATVEQNIVDDGAMSLGAHTTSPKNICNDTTSCPDPSSSFTMSVDFTP